MLNIDKNGAEKIGVKMAILIRLPRGGLLQYRIVSLSSEIERSLKLRYCESVRESRKVINLCVEC